MYEIPSRLEWSLHDHPRRLKPQIRPILTSAAIARRKGLDPREAFRMIHSSATGEVFEIRTGSRAPSSRCGDLSYMTIPLLVGRIPSVNAIEAAVQKDRVLFVLAQRRPDLPDPVSKDLYRVGTVVRVLQLSGSRTGTMRVLVEGLGRARAKKFFKARTPWPSRSSDHRGQGAAGRTARALMRNVLASQRLRPPEPARAGRGALHREQTSETRCSSRTPSPRT